MTAPAYVDPTSEATSESDIPAGTLVEQPHGGAIRHGNPGNRGGVGSMPSALRDRLRGSFAARVKVLEEIADGEPVQKMRVSLAMVKKHLHCASCGAEPAYVEEDGRDVEITVRASASPADRIRAIDTTGKYGLGTESTMTVISPDVQGRLAATLQLVMSRPEWKSEELMGEMERVWR